MPIKHNYSLETLRHSLAHITALAVLRLYRGQVCFGVGPVTEQGFYYDMEIKNSGQNSLSLEELPKIEEEVHKIIKEGLPFKKKTVSISEAKKIFKKLKQPYKLELLKDLEQYGTTVESQKSKIKSQKLKINKVKTVTIYQIGEFVDLCRGPHIRNTREMTLYFKLTKIAGAYWRGNEKNSMLTRIEGVAFETKAELEKYFDWLQEAERRDHRKLGRQLDLFTFSDLVGSGLPLFTPKGTIIIEELKKYIEGVCRKYGFEKVTTPSLAKIELFEISGHAQKFNDELFRVTSPKGHSFVLKPVQCPHHTQLYASRLRSYKELPIRYMESDKMYRAEKPGEVGGLSRVYAITVEDGHIFCRPDQVKDEIKNLVQIIKEFYSSLGLWENQWVSLSLRDYSHPEKYIGDPKDWDKCEKILQEISNVMDLQAKRREGEAALYGPKLDFMFKDALGNEIQIPTIQLDFATPKRFNLTYINEQGKAVNPVMIHRAILGSYERFLALLIEHFAGAFPLWLASVQIVLLPVSSKQAHYSQTVATTLRKEELRVEVWEDETISKRIRQAELQKIPYIIVLGDKEKKEKTVSVRERGSKVLTVLPLEQFLNKIKHELTKKK
ncbi:MAG: Threonine--tRNA ligase 1 [Parcubacteria group bacterium ADurb.Bin305]|nr:MAG: Threonine--tRNA ligase 1 [Parcubacteria group bacterium ADurb.Bin305]